jgi:hypothetical protein
MPHEYINCSPPGKYDRFILPVIKFINWFTRLAFRSIKMLGLVILYILAACSFVVVIVGGVWVGVQSVNLLIEYWLPITSIILLIGGISWYAERMYRRNGRWR